MIAEEAEIAAAVATKIAPDTMLAMRSLVGRMLGENLGDDVAVAVQSSMPSDMGAAFRGEWLKQSAMKSFSRGAADLTGGIPTADSLPSLELFDRSPALEEASRTTSTSRGLDLYKQMLHLGPEDLKGKFLDVGAGSWQNLAYDARRANLPMNVTSIDPRLGLPISRDLADMGNNVARRVIGRLYPEPGTVAATADKLPFADNSFDRVVANFSISRYRTGLRQIFADIPELQRVTKPGGQIHMAPIWEEHVNTYRTAEKALNLPTSWIKEPPSMFPDLESGRPAGVVDQVMIIHKPK